MKSEKQFRDHVKICPQCKTGSLCPDGKKLMDVMDMDHDETSMMASARGLLVCARAGVLFQEGQTIRDDIQWMPPGDHDVEPFVEGEPRPVKLTVTAAMANHFNAQLQYLRSQAAAGKEDVPFLDFNHEDGEAAAEVLALYWGGEDPQTGGIRAKVKWSAAGRAALEGKNFRRFSPQWFLDPETLQPIGVGINLGGLVNRAAFKTIARVVAKDAGAANQKQKPSMTDKEIQDAITNGLTAGLKPVTDRIAALEVSAKGATTAATAQASADEKITKLITDALKPVTDELGVFKTERQNAVKAQAKAAVAIHINRGAIAPEDKTTIEAMETLYVANAAGAEAIMGKLPGKITSRIIRGGGSLTATGTTGEHAFIAKAKEFAKANNITSELQAITAFASTAEGRELYESYRRDVVPVKAH